MGNQGVGGANMNFAADCDDSDTIPGDASVYLYDASPVIFNASDKGSWSMYSHRQPFWPYVSHQGIGQYDSDRFTGYFGGNQFDADSQLIVQTWLIAPKHVDSCDFMIHAFRVISTQGEAKDDLTIGFLVDWNIPSDSFAWNGYGEDLAGTYAYQQGLEFDQDNAVECQENNARFGGIKPLGYWDIANGTLSSAFDFNFAGPVVDSLMLPDGDLDPVKVNDLLNGGAVGEGPSTDLMTVATFFQSYDLAEGDTLTIFAVLAAVENGTQQDLAEVFDKAQEWVGTSPFLLSYPPEIGDTCCTMRGDVNNDGVVNLTDLTCFINPIFLHIWPDPCRSGCHWEANADVNADGNRTLTDLSRFGQSPVRYLCTAAAVPIGSPGTGETCPIAGRSNAAGFLVESVETPLRSTGEKILRLTPAPSPDILALRVGATGGPIRPSRIMSKEGP